MLIESFSQEDFKEIRNRLPKVRNLELLNAKLFPEGNVFIDQVIQLSNSQDIFQWLLSCLDTLYQVRFGLTYAICYYDKILSKGSQNAEGKGGYHQWVFNYFVDNSFLRMFTFYERVAQLINVEFQLGLPEDNLSFFKVTRHLKQHPGSASYELIVKIKETAKRLEGNSFFEWSQYRHGLTHRFDPKLNRIVHKHETGGVISTCVIETEYDSSRLLSMCIDSYDRCCNVTELLVDYFCG